MKSTKGDYLKNYLRSVVLSMILMLLLMGMEKYASAQAFYIFKDFGILVISCLGFWKKKVISFISFIGIGLLLFLIGNYSPPQLVNFFHMILILTLFATIIGFAIITRHTLPQI